MQEILIEKPYEFVPAIRSPFMQRFYTRTGLYVPTLKKRYGVIDHECRHLDLLRESIEAGHGIMLTPNHPRTTDPMIMCHVARETPTPFYAMASWHLFNVGFIRTLILRLMGAFSVNREGLDRKAIDYAVEILRTADRPLLIFPEGTTSRTNDRMMAMLDGPAFIARTAAKKRHKDNGGKVVVHPVGIKYVYQGDLENACEEVLSDIENRLTWKPEPGTPLVDRIVKIGNALLTLKEVQFGLESVGGLTMRQRQTRLVNELLNPLEREWLGSEQEGGVQIRIKSLRMKIFPELTRSEVDNDERHRRWAQLEDTYLAQQIDCYPEHYLVEFPSVDRILETVEKFEEDLTDQCRLHGKMKAIIDFDEAIEVQTKRDKSATTDPLMTRIRERLEAKLDKLQHESRIYQA
ncbi:MAG: lysophospholipid acyltransferase family protein [Planctomycetota bacterium]